MTTFLDGPAKGQMFRLRNAPLYLRVTRDTRNLIDGWDALDEWTDRPESHEELFAYQRVGPSTWMHVRARGGGSVYRGGEYRLVDPQPDEATMRQNWTTWVRARNGEDE